jgi:alkyldihydroxyacetonephosphate synthase
MSVLDTLEVLLGPDRVQRSAAQLAAAAVDCWPVSLKRAALGERTQPLGVVCARSVADVQTALAWARTNAVPVMVRGAGSSVTGASVPGDGELVLDLTGLDAIAIDTENMTVTAGAGVLGGALEDSLAVHGCTTAFSPQSLHRSTVGGWVSTRATGQLSARYGAIEDALAGLEVVLPNGEVVTWRTSPRWSVGPDLRQLFVGAEGTLGIVTQVTLRLHRLPGTTRLQSFSFRTLAAGLAAMRTLAQSGLRPAIVRLYDPPEASHLLGEEREDVLLLLSCEGCASVADAELGEAERLCRGHEGAALGPAPVERWLSRRYDFRAVESVLAAPGGVAETIEVTTSWTNAEAVHAAMTAALHPVADIVWGHFSHVYPQGTSLYVIALAQREDDAAALAALDAIWQRALAASTGAGGSIAHHHGVGLARLPWLQDELGTAHGVLRRVKHALDPTGLLAPGKLNLERPA